MNISLPEPMKHWVEQQVAAGGYGTVSEFFRQLLRAEQQRQLRQEIDNNLHQALDSGESTPMTPADWERIRREGRKRIAAKRRKKQ
jgi:antitoxin ParD1/3/4